MEIKLHVSMVKMHETVVNTHVTLVIQHVTGKQKWHIKLKNYVVTIDMEAISRQEDLSLWKMQWSWSHPKVLPESKPKLKFHAFCGDFFGEATLVVANYPIYVFLGKQLCLFFGVITLVVADYTIHVWTACLLCIFGYIFLKILMWQL